MRNVAIFVIALLAGVASVAAQDLDARRPIREPNLNSMVLSVVPTTTPLGPGVLQLRVTHRFTETINHSTFHDLWGFDSSADIGLGLEYGFTPNLEAGFYRSSFADEYEAHVKFRWLAQSESFPLSISTRIGGSYLSDPSIEKDEAGAFGQLIVQRKLGPLTVIAAPSFASRSWAFERVWNVPVGAVFALTSSVNLDAEVVARNRDNHRGKTAWRVGIEKRLPGHTFALVLGNSRATAVDMELANDFPGGYDSGDVRVGFNITRRWRW